MRQRMMSALSARKQHQELLRGRADQQDRWAARGDPRGVYGAEGAAAMESLSAMPGVPSAVPGAGWAPAGSRRVPPGAGLAVAEVVHTEQELATLLDRRLPSWRYAAFVSVLVQRRDAVASRVRDARMAYGHPSGPALPTAAEVCLFFTERLGDLSDLIGQIDSFMLSTAFQNVFGDPHDGDSADAAGILHTAHRLMDYHDRLLGLSERCRAVRVPADCTDCRALRRDFAALTAVPLDGFASFIDEFSERVGQMADVARYATGDVELDPVALSIDDDDAILERISARLQRISHSC